MVAPIPKKEVIVLASLWVVLLGCASPPNYSIRDLASIDPTQESSPECTIIADRKVDSLPPANTTETKSVAFGLSIHVNRSAEFVDLIAPLDTAFSPVQTRKLPEIRGVASFSTPGEKNLTVILKNPETNIRFQCSIQLIVRRYEFVSQAYPDIVQKGQQVEVESVLLGNVGTVSYRAVVQDGEIRSWDPAAGKGMIVFSHPGDKKILLIAEDLIQTEQGTSVKNSVTNSHLVHVTVR